MKTPTLRDVLRYFKECTSTPDLAKAFYDRYEANGWTVTRMPTAETNWQPTRKPMKRWKGAAKAFIERNRLMIRNRTYRRLA